jgi:Domain of unknown function (DU1801)
VEIIGAAGPEVMTKMPKNMPDNVQAAFTDFPAAARETLLAIRALIFEVAESIDGAGPLAETLKWAEPAYLTDKKVGSTIRLGWKEKQPQQVAIYFICTTKLVDDFRSQFEDELNFEGNRAIILPLDKPLPIDALEVCLAAALSYHKK